MKTLFKLCLLVFLSSFFSCSSDDDSISGNTVTVEGTWTLSALRVESSFDFNNDGVASRNLFEETPCYDNDFINFNSDGSVNIDTALTEITIEVMSSTEYMHVYECLDGFQQSSTWTKNGNTIIVENGSQDLVGTISGNKLTVVIEDFFQIEMYDGMNFSYPEEDVQLVYTKQ